MSRRSRRAGSAEAFFDVFFELSAGGRPVAGTRRRASHHPFPGKNPEPGQSAFALSGPITHKPPTDGATFTSASQEPVPLLDAAGAPTGWSMTPPTLSVAPTARATRVLECYKTDKGQDVNDPFLLETRNFGRDEVLVRNATVMCEGAIKSKTAVPNLPPPPVIWQCLNVANGETVADDFRITTNNFGDDRITVRKLVMLCENAIKTRVIPARARDQHRHRERARLRLLHDRGQAGAAAVPAHDAKLRPRQRPRDPARAHVRAGAQDADPEFPGHGGHAADGGSRRRLILRLSRSSWPPR